MASYPEYRADIEEIHHTQIGCPDGTAITLSKKLPKHTAATRPRPTAGEASRTQIPIKAVRQDSVPVHTLTWQSDVDKLVFTHEAFNQQRLCPWRRKSGRVAHR